MDNVYYVLILISTLVIIIIILHYFLKKYEINENNEKIIIENFDFDNYVLPKIIWIYWHDPNNIPLCVQQMLTNHTSTIKEWEIIFLSDKSLYKYIPLDDTPSFEDIKIVQQKADWIRLYLLEKYGGCWCDASVIINDESELCKLRDESLAKKSLFTGFYHGKFCKTNKFKHVEVSFMIAPKNSSVIKAWRKEFEKAINMGLHEYRRLLKKNKNLKLRNIYRHCFDIYFTVYACFYNVSEYFNQEIKDHFILYDARDTIYKFLTECLWLNTRAHRRLNNDKNVKKIPFIKLINANRKNLDLTKYYSL